VAATDNRALGRLASTSAFVLVISQRFVQDEGASVAQLRELLGLTIEAISFILLLIDYKLPDTIKLYVESAISLKD
jgi:hypothetical protein